MTEEQVTKAIIRWLLTHGWEIISFDYPQSGTGRCIHPDDTNSKTFGIWIPDIVAIRDNKLIFFENKDRFVLKDFEKVQNLKTTSCYLKSINEITSGHQYQSIYYGIGFPLTQNCLDKAMHNKDMIDFLVCVIDNENLEVKHDRFAVFD